MELAKRFRGMLADLALKPAQAAKMLHVSLRTVHNWNSGKHQIPVMAYKLLRLLRYRELPGQSWVGWSFSRGQLVTPEGRTISGSDSAWWSLLVRRAHGFTELYQRQKFEKLAELQTSAQSGLAAEGSVPDAGLVTSKTNIYSSDICQDKWGQDGAIMEPWPTISDFPLLSMPTHENGAYASESALTPCSVSPSMPTSGNPSCQSPKHPEALTSTPDIPGLRLTPSPSLLQLVNLSSSPDRSDKNLPVSSDKPANSDGFEAGKVAA
jgi:hypothetical protein